MLRHLRISENKIVECDPANAQIFLYTEPDETERRFLVEQLKIDEHTLNSALDPDELSRIELEPEHVALITKRPKNYSSKDNFLFRVASTGLFLFSDKLVLVMADDVPIFEGKPFQTVISLQDIILRHIRRSIFHFQSHLKVINMISDELEREINTAMENKHLLNMFTLEKSLVYYLNAINSNHMVLEKLKALAAKLNLTPEQLEQLDDTIIENNQSHELAQIYSNILASLMDARASIVANNLNVLMKTLNIIMIALMLPTLVVSIFSMNVDLPLPQQGSHVSFWFIMFLAAVSVIVVATFLRNKK